MKRQHDWMLRLEQLVKSRQHERFGFGSHDCSLWACDAVLAVTGRDPGADLRGAYSDEAGAALVIAAGGGLGAIASARLGPEIPPLMAATGDVGLITTEGAEALAVCVGERWLAAAAFGLIAVPTGSVLRAWRCEVI